MTTPYCTRDDTTYRAVSKADDACRGEPKILGVVVSGNVAPTSRRRNPEGRTEPPTEGSHPRPAGANPQPVYMAISGIPVVD